MTDENELEPAPEGDESAHRACPSCGAPLGELDTFCPECHKSVETFFAPRPTGMFEGNRRGIAIMAAVVLGLTLLCFLAFTMIVERTRSSISEPLREPPPPVTEPQPDPLDLAMDPLVSETNVVAEPVVVVVEEEPKRDPAPSQGRAEAQRRYEKGLALEKQAVALTRDPDGALHFIKNALREYRAAASQGHADALFRMAEIHAKGIFMPANPERAVEYYLDAARGGVRRAKDATAALFVDGLVSAEDCPDCMAWLLSGADRGAADPVYALGKAHIQGELVPKDYKKALYYLRKAAQAGRADAMNDLAYLLLSNEDGLRDLPKAHSFFLRGASGGKPEGLTAFYGWLRQQIVKDLDARQPMRGPGDMMVLRKSTGLVVRGEVKSVGKKRVTVTQKGSPTELDFEDIDVNSRTMLDPKFRELVAGLRLHESLAALAEGRVDPLQPAEGRADIQRANGLALKNGSYGVRDYPAAFVWLRSAANQDDVAAMYYLGEMYYRGYGTDRNLSLALAWMERAKSGGYAPATAFIRRHWEKQDKYAQMQRIARDALAVERARHARALEGIGSEPAYNVFFNIRTGAVPPGSAAP